MSAAVKQFVDEAITKAPVTVFSKSYCPYCKKAIACLEFVPNDKKNIIQIENRSDMDAIQDYLGVITGGRSVPRVFIGGKFLGGGDDTAAAKKTGQLEKLVAEAIAKFKLY